MYPLTATQRRSVIAKTRAQSVAHSSRDEFDPMVGPLKPLPTYILTLEDHLKQVAIRQRTVFVAGDIEQDTAKEVCLEIEAIRLQGTDPIRLIINSRGGDVSYGAQIIGAVSQLMRSGIEVTAEVRGDADSMAAIIACACSRIEMHRLSRLMFHGVSGLTWGDVQDHEAERQEMDRITDELVEVVFARVKNPLSKFADRKYLRQILRDKRPVWLGPTEAVEAGIADSILN
jgi:ATP-dependent Clp protease protease subunit